MSSSRLFGKTGRVFPYALICQGVFGAQLFQVELSDPALVGQVNGWVRERTGEMIPFILDRPLTRDAAALLVNALYLENTWLYEFDPQNTRKGTFAHGDDTAGEMEFLGAQSCRQAYLSTEDAQGVVLPYDDGRLGFFALMPREGLSLEDWLTGQAAPTGGDLIRLLADAEEAQFFTLRLPKFEAEWAGGLKEALTGLGIGLAFDPERADFSRLGDHPQGYFLGEVHHAAKIAVHEKGSKAAAATAVVMCPGSALDPEGISLVFDRPFLYGIVDLEGGVPLFLGTFE